jgi:hypothetical protein
LFNFRESKEKTFLRYLFAAYFNQKILNWLLKNRSEDWVGYLKNETVETMKTKDEPWIKEFVITGTQDFLDAMAHREDTRYQSKKIIPKNPYLFELLKLLDIKCTFRQNREVLEDMIIEGIKKSGILAKG